MMRKIGLILIGLLIWVGFGSAQERVVKLKVIETSDVHGNFYPYDFIQRRPASGSWARVHSLVEKERQEYGDRLLLLDNGDVLQGQPSAYYYNYMDTTVTHLAAEMMNFMRYDAGNMGNHDVETGRKVFDRWAGDCRFPILGANIIDTATGEPHFKPYEVFERDGVKIVVLGMITPAIPVWLSENLWQGLRFDDMEETARRWMKIIQKQEKPDVVIGMFHAGKEAHWLGGSYRENASVEVAQRVPGFDVVLMGHDHQRVCEKVVNVAGDSVLIIDPANNANVVSDVDITLTLKGKKVIDKKVEGRLTRTRDYGVSQNFLHRFANRYATVYGFVNKEIGFMSETITTRDAYFGPSAFIDLIHELQLAISGAEISLAAPLSYDAKISQGRIFVSDMFSLYKYENMLYTMRLTGQEIHDVLEMSYGMWTNRMQSADDHLLLLDENSKHKFRFRNISFNFDTAAGIRYTVDVTKPEGERVSIESMADGTPFDLNREYRVAVNSYRGNGGGELLTRGAGIPQEELKQRIIASTDKDLRYYLMQYIEQKREIAPRPLNQWKFIPEEWTLPASKRDYELLFGKK